MWNNIAQRIDLAREMVQHPWVKRIAFVWGVIGFLAAAVSKFLPQEIAADSPGIYKFAFWLVATTIGWISVSGWLLIALSLLTIASLEFAYRVRREEQTRLQYLNPTQHPERGLLDFLVEGIQAVVDIDKKIRMTGVETGRLNKMLRRHAWLVQRVTSPKLKRLILSRTAKNMNVYSRHIERAAEFIAAATPAVAENQTRFIEGSPINSAADGIALSGYIATIEQVEQILPNTTNNLEGMRAATEQVRGVTSDLTVASNRMDAALSGIIQQINGFGAALTQLRTASLQRIANPNARR